MKRTMLLLIGTVFFGSLNLAAADIRLKVKHDHRIGSCRGEIVFGESAVSFETAKKKHARVWKYADIQQIGLLGPKKLAILTYEDRKMALGKDRIFNFEIFDGEVNEALFTFLEKHVTKPLVSGIIPAGVPVKYSIPVKHLKRWGGTQGTLEITDAFVAYRTSARLDSRIWRYGDISSIGSTGPYQLRLTAMERVNGEHGGEKNFVFDLKERLSEEAYDFIWWKVNGPAISVAP
jgi:hypothetical protein